MKSFAAGDYAKAMDYFADGIKKEDAPNLYSGFIASNLVTGKYPEINSGYNRFTDGIHASLVQMYGLRAVTMFSIAKQLVPYNINGGNKLPADYPETVALQIKADYEGYVTLKQQVDNTIKK